MEFAVAMDIARQVSSVVKMFSYVHRLMRCVAIIDIVTRETLVVTLVRVMVVCPFLEFVVLMDIAIAVTIVLVPAWNKTRNDAVLVLSNMHRCLQLFLRSIL